MDLHVLNTYTSRPDARQTDNTIMLRLCLPVCIDLREMITYVIAIAFVPILSCCALCYESCFHCTISCHQSLSWSTWLHKRTSRAAPWIAATTCATEWTHCPQIDWDRCSTITAPAAAAGCVCLCKIVDHLYHDDIEYDLVPEIQNATGNCIELTDLERLQVWLRSLFKCLRILADLDIK
jgi:hypothetical protein